MPSEESRRQQGKFNRWMIKRKEKKWNRKTDYIIKGITERNHPSVTGGDENYINDVVFVED